jgi:hypothetical protein
MAFVLSVNRTSDELFASPLAALLAASAASLSAELANEEQLADPLRECRGLSCEQSKGKIYYCTRKLTRFSITHGTSIKKSVNF